MVEQGHNYLDRPVQAMSDFYETRIENLENSIPPSVPPRTKNKDKKWPRKRKGLTFNNTEDEDSDQDEKGTTDEYIILKATIWQAKQKKGEHFKKHKRAPSMKSI